MDLEWISDREYKRLALKTSSCLLAAPSSIYLPRLTILRSAKNDKGAIKLNKRYSAIGITSLNALPYQNTLGELLDIHHLGISRACCCRHRSGSMMATWLGISPIRRSWFWNASFCALQNSVQSASDSICTQQNLPTTEQAEDVREFLATNLAFYDVSE